MTKQQHEMVDDILHRFGAWAYQDDKKINMIGMLMQSTAACDGNNSVPLSDREGIIVDGIIVTSVIMKDQLAKQILVAHYICGMSELVIAKWYKSVRKDGKSLTTSRRDIKEILEAVRVILYPALVTYLVN